ncbi:MAG: alpha/beta fold hydrolase [Candidatus Acidiferrales bacterium]
MKIVQSVLAVALLQVVAMIALGAPVQAQETDPETHARQVIDQMMAGKFSAIEAQYDPAMKAALPAGKLSDFWQQLNSQAGSFKKVTDVSEKVVQGYQVVTLVCDFQQATLDTIISFTSDGHIGGIRFVPHHPKAEWTAPPYAKPDSFHEQSITVTSGHWELPGTLTLPIGDGPFPAVVLVHGSGPQDEDETIGPNETFKDLAWGLATKGVAVLRYTRRIKKYGAKWSDDPSAYTVNDEVINDAQAAVDLLSKQPKINSKRVFVLGHSWGGYLAPRIVTGDPQVYGIIIFAGSARPLEKMIVEQLQYFSTLPRGSSEQLQKQLAAAEQSEKQIENPELKSGDTIELMGAKVDATYFLDLRGYDPPAVAAKLSIPILVLQGGRDYQVRDADFAAWKKSLEGKPSVEFKRYADLNHLFQTGSGMATPAEYDNLGHVAEPVIADIAAWILASGNAK